MTGRPADGRAAKGRPATARPAPARAVPARAVKRLRARGRRALMVAGLAVAALIGLAGPASAHAVLEQTAPEAGGTVTTAPDQVVLDFDETVGIDTGSVQVLDVTGHRVDDGETRHGRSGSLVVVGLRSGLATGTYVVSWRATSADSHPVAGAFTFGVGVRPDVTAATRIGHRDGSATVGWADGTARFAAELGLVLALGGGAFLIGLWPAGLRRRGPPLLLATGWGLTIVAALALIGLEGPYGAGLGLGAVGRWSLLSQTLHSRYGHLELIRIVLVGLAVPLVRRVAAAATDSDRAGDPAAPSDTGAGRSAPAVGARWPTAALAVIGIAAAVTLANAGHGGTGGGAALATASLTLHVTAVCVWLGGLVVLGGFLLRRDDAPLLARLMPRWSRVAMVAVAVVAGTGLYQAWREIGPLGAITGTAYGQLVALKVVLFAAMLGCGALANRWVARRARRPVDDRAGAKPRRGDHIAHLAFRTDVGLLRRLVAIEAAVAAAVLLVTAVLVNEQPGRTAYAPTIARTVTTGPLTAQIDISPTRRGVETVHVYVFDQDGRPRAVQQVTGQISLPGRGIGPLSVPFIAAGPDHAIADALDVPFPGEWQLAVTIRVDDFDQYSAVVTYRVR